MSRLIGSLASVYRRHIRRFIAGTTPAVGFIIELDVPEFPRNIKVDVPEFPRDLELDVPEFPRNITVDVRKVTV